jgi:hypothetical protein
MPHCRMCAIRSLQTDPAATPTVVHASLSLSGAVDVGVNTDRLAVRVAADMGQSELDCY